MEQQMNKQGQIHRTLESIIPKILKNKTNLFFSIYYFSKGFECYSTCYQGNMFTLRFSLLPLFQ